MKVKFYGKRMIRYYYFDKWDFQWMLNELNYHVFIPSKKLENMLESLERCKKEKNFTYEDDYIYIREEVIRDNEILDVLEDIFYIPNIKETISIKGKDVVVLNKKFDADNNIMHIYTDMALKTDMSRYEKTKKDCVDEMINLINQYILRLKEYEENRDIERKEQEEGFIDKIVKWFKGE